MVESEAGRIFLCEHHYNHLFRLQLRDTMESIGVQSITETHLFISSETYIFFERLSETEEN